MVVKGGEAWLPGAPDPGPRAPVSGDLTEAAGLGVRLSGQGEQDVPLGR